MTEVWEGIQIVAHHQSEREYGERSKETPPRPSLPKLFLLATILANSQCWLPSRTESEWLTRKKTTKPNSLSPGTMSQWQSSPHLDFPYALPLEFPNKSLLLCQHAEYSMGQFHISSVRQSPLSGPGRDSLLQHFQDS